MAGENSSTSDKSLGKFDKAFTDLIVGLAVTLLFAVILAPAHFFNWEIVDQRVLESETATLVGETAIGTTDTLTAIKFISKDTSFSVTKDSMLIFKKGEPPSLFDISWRELFSKRGLFSKSIWEDISALLMAFLFTLWVVKYIHENIAFNYALSKRPEINFSLKTKVSLFIIKLCFLGSLYWLISSIYLNSCGHLNGNTHIGIAIFVLAGYMIPDVIYVFSITENKSGYKIWHLLRLRKDFRVRYNQLDRKKDDVLKQAVVTWINEDKFNTIFVIYALSLAIFADIGQLLLHVFFIIILIINVADWGRNWKFFFDYNIKKNNLCQFLLVLLMIQQEMIKGKLPKT